MKKLYVMPQTAIIEVKTQSHLLNYSETESNQNAVTLSRENDSDWDE